MSFNQFDLTGKVAIVTGSSRGIGKAIAKALAEAGANVVISSRKEEAVLQVAEEISKIGPKCIGIACHVGQAAQRENLIAKTVEEFGRLDILVNNAAVSPAMGPIINIQEPVFDKLMEINVKGVLFLSIAASKVMMKQKSGKIINIASAAGIKPDPVLGGYSVSKAAVIHMTKVLARDLASSNIQVNAIAPSLTKTDFSKPIWSNPSVEKTVISNMLLANRLEEPEDLVGAAVFLASKASDYMYGQTIVIDGGFTI